MKQIFLTQGQVTLVDDSDFDRLQGFNWWADRRDNKWYARGKQQGRLVYMHRLLTGAPSNRKVDHKDGDGLNNQRCNLRVCTQGQNSRNNSGKRNLAFPTSQFVGVSWHRRRKRWRAYLVLNGVQHSLGYYDEEREAAKAYNRGAIFCFGEYASLNHGL